VSAGAGGHTSGSGLPSPYELDQWLEAAAGIARQAGDIVRGRFACSHEESFKGDEGNLVTEADRASEELIVRLLGLGFPTHAVRAEEGGARNGGAVTWVVDPLDGTNNFAHSFPMFAVNLAAIAHGRVLLGVTYDPLRQELFSARLGGGAHLNDRPIHVSGRARLAAALVATGFPYDRATNPDNNVAEFDAVVLHVRGIRRTGSAALDLAYVAAGRLDAYWERGTAAWDVAAGILLVEEAGGRVSDYLGQPPVPDGGRFLASNRLVHEELLARLRSARAAGPGVQGPTAPA
jgi:myo-inositol-1(or 4)-monophosphatase